MNTQMIEAGGVQQIKKWQMVFLDFSSDKLLPSSEPSVRNEGNIEYSNYPYTQITQLTNILNNNVNGVLYVTERPENQSFYTVFVGLKSDIQAANRLDAMPKENTRSVVLHGNETIEQMVSMIDNEVKHFNFMSGYERTNIKTSETANVFTGSINDNQSLTLSLNSYSSSYNVNFTEKAIRFDIQSGCAATLTYVHGYMMTVYAGAVAYDTKIFSNLNTEGSLYRTTVVSGGSINNLYGNNGFTQYGTDDAYIESMNGLTVNAEARNLYFCGSVYTDNAVLYNTTIYAQGASKYGTLVLSNSIAYNTQMMMASSASYNPKMVLKNGGIAYDTKVHDYANVFISSGGKAERITLSQGGIYVSSGGVVSNAIISGNGRLFLNSGGSAYNTTYQDTIISSGYIYDWTKQIGSAALRKGDIAYNNTLVSKGYQYLFSGGEAYDTIINNGGYQYVSSGGKAEKTTVNSKGFAYVNDGGLIKEITLNSAAKVHLSSGARVEKGTLNSGGVMYVSSGGNAIDIVQNDGGSFVVDVVGNDRDTKITGVNSSGDFALNNGSAVNFIVYSSGSINVGSGGILNNVIITSGGAMRITSGGLLTGEISIGAGATTYIEAGGKVNFSLAGRTTLDRALIDNISLLGNYFLGSYSITVKSNQSSGLYKLASGAAGFNNTITIGNGMVNYGTLTVNGSDISYGGYSYSLKKDNGSLYLNVVSAAEGKIIKSDIDGNGISDILFQNLSDPANPLGAWMNADPSQWNGALGPAPRSEWIVYGAFDFNGDGKSDIMFRNIGAAQGAVGYYDSGDNMKFTTIGWGVDLDWDLAMVGDVNGDGRSDILWQNKNTNGIGLWLDGENNWASVWGNVDSSWKLCGMGDVNNDGKDDIIINANGRLGAWNVQNAVNAPNSGAAPEWIDFGIALSNEWNVEKIADFDANGQADLLVWNQNGYVGVFMNSNANDFRTVFANASHAEWGLPGIGDYNGDGNDDILVRNLETGALGYWSGADNFEWKEIGFGVDSNWAVIA